jgi:hypothetical protein
VPVYLSTWWWKDQLFDALCSAGSSWRETILPTKQDHQNPTQLHLQIPFEIQCVRKVAVHLGLCLWIKLNGLRSVSTLVDITSNNFYMCTSTFRTQICRKCLRIKLKEFRPVQTLVDITSNTFFKCIFGFPIYTPIWRFTKGIAYRNVYRYRSFCRLYALASDFNHVNKINSKFPR